MPVAAPTNLSYGKVVWQSVSDIDDGTDTDSLPDFIAPTGTVTFVASVVAGRNITAIPNPVTVLRDPITGILDAQGYLCTPDPVDPSQAGARGVLLIATDDPDLNPRDWVYNVTYQVKGRNGRSIPLLSHQIYVPTYTASPNNAVDLTSVGPVDNAAQIGVPAAEALAALASASATSASVSATSAAASAASAASSLINSTTFVESIAASRSMVQVNPYRNQPNMKILTTFQVGHGWSANTGTWVADTTDFALGTQSIFTTIPASTPYTFRKFNLPAFDATAHEIAMLMKVDDIAKLSDITLYLGTSSLANYRVALVGYGGVIANSCLPSNQWTWVYFSGTGQGSSAGTPNLAATTDLQIRVASSAVGALDFRINAVALIPRQNRFPQGVISLACDDGRASVVERGVAKMDQYGWGMTSYIIAEYVGLANKVSMQQLLDLERFHRWEVAGHSFTAAAHTATYPGLTDAQVEEDVYQLKKWLLDNRFKAPDLFAWPGGQQSASTRAIVGKYFTMARAIIRHPIQTLTGIDQPMRVRSHSITSADSLATIKTVVNQAIASGSWLILTFHDLSAAAPVSSTEWNVADFNNLMDYIASLGVPVKNVGDVLDLTRGSFASNIDGGVV